MICSFILGLSDAVCVVSASVSTPSLFTLTVPTTISSLSYRLETIHFHWVPAAGLTGDGRHRLDYRVPLCAVHRRCFVAQPHGQQVASIRLRASRYMVHVECHVLLSPRHPHCNNGTSVRSRSPFYFLRVDVRQCECCVGQRQWGRYTGLFVQGNSLFFSLVLFCFGCIVPLPLTNAFCFGVGTRLVICTQALATSQAN